MTTSITGAQSPVPSEDDTRTCEICYSQEKDTILCWNSHLACMVCYEGMWNIVGKKCGFCRDKLFDWHGDTDPWPTIRPMYSRVHHEFRGEETFGLYLWRYVRGEITRDALRGVIASFSMTGVGTGGSFPDLTSEQLQLLAILGNAPNSLRPEFAASIRAVLEAHNCMPGTERYDLLRRDLYLRRFPRSSRPLGDYQDVDVTLRLLHEDNRLWPFLEDCNEQNGRVIGLTDEMNDTHPDYEWLRNYSFLEEQLYTSPNFVREVAPAGAGTSRYKYIGRRGPMCDGQRVPFPHKDYNDHTIGPRCGHCKHTRHTAFWHTNPRRSECPRGNEKDEFRKMRVDRLAIAAC
jgi:hypothetical protein